jgi:regulator of protease activity HflC (stomatin/prohibitin superfamily)
MGAGLILLAIIVVYLLASIRVLRQYERGVVFFLGKFETVRGPGLTLLLCRSRAWYASRCAP